MSLELTHVLPVKPPHGQRLPPCESEHVQKGLQLLGKTVSVLGRLHDDWLSSSCVTLSQSSLCALIYKTGRAPSSASCEDSVGNTHHVLITALAIELMAASQYFLTLQHSHVSALHPSGSFLFYPKLIQTCPHHSLLEREFHTELCSGDVGNMYIPLLEMT